MVVNTLKLFFILFFIIVLPIKTESIYASEKKITEIRNIMDVSFSPNKRYLAFEAATVTNNKPEKYYSLWYIDIKNKKLIKLDDEGDMPSWSPDNRKIAYSFGDWTGNLPKAPYLDVKIVDIKTQKKISIRSFLPLSSNLIHKPFLNPKWSPTDSNKLVFVVQSKDQKGYYLIKNLYLLNIKEKSFIKLTENDLASPTGWGWSADGKYIYYASIKLKRPGVFYRKVIRDNRITLVRTKPKEQGIYRINVKTLKRERIISDNNIKYYYLYDFYFSPYSKKGIYNILDGNSKFDFYIFKELNKGFVKPLLLFSKAKNISEIFWSPTSKNELLYEADYFNKSGEIEKTEIGKVNIKTLQTKKLFNLPTDEFLIDWISSLEIVIQKNGNQLFEINLKTGKREKLFPF